MSVSPLFIEELLQSYSVKYDHHDQYHITKAYVHFRIKSISNFQLPESLFDLFDILEIYPVLEINIPLRHEFDLQKLNSISRDRILVPIILFPDSTKKYYWVISFDMYYNGDKCFCITCLLYTSPSPRDRG